MTGDGRKDLRGRRMGRGRQPASAGLGTFRKAPARADAHDIDSIDETDLTQLTGDDDGH